MIPAGIVSAASIIEVVGGGAFLPSDLPNLEFWIDAADTATITEAGGSVSQIDDKSGNGRHAVQATASDQPQTGGSLNGQPALLFDDSWLEVTGLPGTGDYLYCCAVRQTDTSNFSVFGVSGSSTYIPVGAFGNAATAHTFIDGTALSSPAVEYLTDGESVQSIVTRGDISAAIAGGSFMASQGPAITQSPVLIGRSSSTAYALNGPIAEAFIYSGTMSLADKQKLQGYSAWKHNWVADLPVDHPYKSAAP